MRLPAAARVAWPAPVPESATLAEVSAAVRAAAAAIRSLETNAAPDGLGLRLPARAAGELAAPGRLDAFRATLSGLGLRVLAADASPSERGREGAERVRYTALAACLLARLLPPGVEGSLGSLPADRVRGRADEEEIVEDLRRIAEILWRLSYIEDRTIVLALETRPGSWLPTARCAASFLVRRAFSRSAVSAFSRSTGLPVGAAEDTLHRHLGVCLDAAALPADAEDPAETLQAIRAAGVRVAKAVLPHPESAVGRKLAAAIDRLTDRPVVEVSLQ